MPKYNVASGRGMADKMTAMQWVINHMNTYELSGVQSVLASDRATYTLIASKMFETGDNADSAAKMTSTYYTNWFQNDQVTIMDSLADDVNRRISRYFPKIPYVSTRTTRREAILVMICDQAVLGDYWWTHIWGRRDQSAVSPLAALLTYVSLGDVGNEENASDMILKLKESGQIPDSHCVLLAQAKALYMFSRGNSAFLE